MGGPTVMGCEIAVYLRSPISKRLQLGIAILGYDILNMGIVSYTSNIVTDIGNSTGLDIGMIPIMVFLLSEIWDRRMVTLKISCLVCNAELNAVIGYSALAG